MTLFDLWFSQGICPVVGWSERVVGGTAAQAYFLTPALLALTWGLCYPAYMEDNDSPTS